MVEKSTTLLLFHYIRYRRKSGLPHRDSIIVYLWCLMTHFPKCINTQKPSNQSTIWSLDCGQYTMEVSVIFPSNQFSKKLYVYVNCFQMWPVTLALLSYLAVSSAFTSPFGIMSSSVGESRACPVPMNNFDLSQVRPVTIKKSLSAISRIFSTFQ